MKTHHEGLDHALAAALACGNDGLSLAGIEPDRLLAQHVLARLQGFDGPLHVQVIGQRIVDGLDFRVGEQRLVAAVAAFDPEARGDARGAGGIARSERDDAPGSIPQESPGSRV
jgi:hypothetical protein